MIDKIAVGNRADDPITEQSESSHVARGRSIGQRVKDEAISITFQGTPQLVDDPLKNFCYPSGKNYPTKWENKIFGEKRCNLSFPAILWLFGGQVCDSQIIVQESEKQRNRLIRTKVTI